MRATAPAPAKAAANVQGAAVQLDRDLELRHVKREFRAPTSGEVRIRVEWAGLAESDLKVARTGDRIAQWPAVPGRGVFGRIDAVGAGVDLPVDTPVVVDPRFPCHDCAQCAIDPDRCLHPSHLGEHCPGGFATHCLLPATNVLRADDVDGSIGVLADPLARGMHGIQMLDRPPRRVAVVGYGPTGALLHLALRITFPEVEVVAVESLPSRIALARALGATDGEGATIDRSFDTVFVTAACRGSLARVLELCNDEGRVVIFTLPEDETEADLSPIVERHLVVRGSHAFSKELPQALKMIGDHPQTFRPVVAEAIELSELPRLLRREIEAPRGLQVVVRP